MIRFAISRAAVALALFLGSAPAFADAMYKNEADLVAAVRTTFVDIYNRGLVDEATGPGTPPRIRDEVGSGFIVEPSGIIVTNSHVVAGAYSLFVTLGDGTHVPAKLLGKALNFDIAVLKIDVGRPLAAARLGDSDTVRVGDGVVAIGNPLGFANSVASGIVSALHRDLGLSAYDDLIQIDAPINQGNSGGPLFNMNGEVIGVNQAIHTQNRGGSIGIGFAIPINEAKFLVENVKKFGKPHIGWLGATAQTITPGMARALGRGVDAAGAIVADVTPGGPAARGGLLVGDVVLKIDGQPIATTSALNQTIAISVDRTIQARVLREGAEVDLSIRVLPWPEEIWSTKLASPPKIKSIADLGLAFAATAGRDGPVVESVAENSIAWSAGFKPRDTVRRIMSKDVRTMDDLMNEIHALRAKSATDANVLLSGPSGVRWVALSISE